MLGTALLALKHDYVQFYRKNNDYMDAMPTQRKARGSNKRPQTVKKKNDPKERVIEILKMCSWKYRDARHLMRWREYQETKALALVLYPATRPLDAVSP